MDLATRIMKVEQVRQMLADAADLLWEAVEDTSVSVPASVELIDLLYALADGPTDSEVALNLTQVVNLLNDEGRPDPADTPDPDGIETFFVSREMIEGLPVEDRELYSGPGWYWWPCQPGCLPEGDPVGPYKSKGEAQADAELIG